MIDMIVMLPESTTAMMAMMAMMVWVEVSVDPKMSADAKKVRIFSTNFS